MNVSAPILDVIPGARGLVISTLVRLSGQSTGRGLALQAGVPPVTTARVLSELVDAGIVDVASAGRASLYSLNRDHLAARALVELAGLRLVLVEDLRSQIGHWKVPAIAGWLFGSTARADGDRTSDIDLLFVGGNDSDTSTWEEQLGGLADRVERQTGNSVQIVEHSQASFRALETSGASLINSLRTDGVELVAGSWPAATRAAA